MLLGRFIPRDAGFFDLFNQFAAHVSTCAALLSELLSDPARQADLVRAIKDEEHKADQLMHTLNQRLDRSFITPIDREDIHMLAARLDDVVDLLDGTARRVEMLHVGTTREHAVQLAHILVRASAEIVAAVAGIKKPVVVKTRVTEIKMLEEEGDTIYQEAVGQLFEGKPDPIEVLRWKEIYDTLEGTIDSCQAVGQAIHSISLKYA
jgi:predicted phosphate transport protein (TIGR00153 family)